ncbi:MAG: outer membrane beta-barrel protein [Balneolaceae bacterium]
MSHRILFIVGIFLAGSMLKPQTLQAQSPFFDDIQIGASLNYSTLHYDSDLASLNDLIQYDYGNQIHAYLSSKLSKNLSLQTGVEFLLFKYNFQNSSSKILVADNSPEGYSETTAFYSMIGQPITYYIGLPVLLKYKLHTSSPMYLITGPKLYKKIGYSNSTSQVHILNSETNEKELLFESEYDVPQRANSLKISYTVGIGYQFSTIPINTEVKVNHSITPYRSGNSSVSSWYRGFAITLLYRFENQ